MEIKTLPVQPSGQPPAVQQPQEDMVLEHFSDTNLDALLNATGRSMHIMPNDEHNDSGFDAILGQVGGRYFNPSMVKLLRRKVGYADGRPLEGTSCLDVADLFKHSVVIICRDSENQVAELFLAAPDTCVNLSWKAEHLFGNFAWNCESLELSQKKIGIYRSLFGITRDFIAATVYDVTVEILRRPSTITLVSNHNGHFDAAPHKDLFRVGNEPLQGLLERAGDLRSGD
jgi:hypothetical protein